MNTTLAELLARIPGEPSAQWPQGERYAKIAVDAAIARQCGIEPAVARAAIAFFGDGEAGDAGMRRGERRDHRIGPLLRHQHAEQLHGRAGNNLIRPDELNEVDRLILKEAFRQARKLQQRLRLDYQL